MKRIIITYLLVSISGVIFSQTISDALRFTQTNYGSTARFLGFGGAYGALGGDFSSLSLNPAGIGVYRASEFSFTPAFVYNSSSSRFLSQKNEDFTYIPNLGNLGLVYTSNSKSDRGWVSTSFGLGYNRGNDFNKDIIISGTSPNSMTNFFLNNANGKTLDNLDTYYGRLAFDTYLIDTVSGQPGQYKTYNTSTNMLQRKTIESRGSSGAFVVSLGANYSNKLYLGLTAEMNTYYYSETALYSENNNNTISASNPLESFNYTQNYSTSGTGYTLKLGAIYKPFELLRIGAAFHTPTFYYLHDEINYSINALYTNNVGPYSGAQNAGAAGVYNYSFMTPMKVIGSVALNLGHFMILSADYEYVDYSAMKFHNGDGNYNYSTENANIKDKFRATSNIRTGAEIKLGTFSLRGGYDLYGNPYKSSLSNDYSFDNYSISGGLGIRQKNFFIDAAYVYNVEKDKSGLAMFDGDTSPTITTTGNKYLLTIGFRF